MKVLAFELDGELMGIESRFVYRVLEEFPVTPVCFTPAGYMGLVYYRGEIFDVINLACLLSKNTPMSTGKNRFIIVRWSNRKMILSTGAIHNFFWIENGEPWFTGDGKNIRKLEPNEMWETIKAMPYGPFQV